MRALTGANLPAVRLEPRANGKQQRRTLSTRPAVLSSPTRPATGGHNVRMEHSEDTIQAVRALIEAKKAELLEAEKVRDEFARQAADVQAEVDALNLALVRQGEADVGGEFEATGNDVRRELLH